MRIGFDAKRLYSNVTGLGNYSRAVLRDLAQFYPEHAYHLYTPVVKPGEETDYFSQHPAYRTHHYRGRLKWLWRSYGITSRLQNDRIELYHGLSQELPIMIHRSGIKSVVTIHDIIFEILPETYPMIDRAIYRRKFQRSCHLADRVVAISESTKRDLVERYAVDPIKIEVVYQSCHPLFYEAVSPSAGRPVIQGHNLPSEYVLSVGSITERKNLGVVVAAYEQLSPHERVPWVIVGRGKKHQRELTRQITQKGLERWVIWINDLTETHQLRALYRGALALIYPSLYEGFGLPVVEGLLSETPVITSNTSSLPEAGGPHSVYVDPKRADEVANALRSVLNDTARRIIMKEAGRRYATEKFSQQAVTNRLVEVYRRTLLNG